MRAMALLIALVLVACNQGPIETTQRANLTSACMSFQWSTSEQIKAICGIDDVYGVPNQACLVNGYIYVGPEPYDFNDEKALLSMGHEMLHALGGKHK